jgi:uncharacterized protein
VPTRSVLQSLAAAAVHEPNVDFEADVSGMTKAAEATRYAAVTHAVRAATTAAGSCVPGDVLGIIAGEVVEIGTSVAQISTALLARLFDTDAELVTLIRGSQMDDDSMRATREWIAREHPQAEVTSHDGGQDLWPLLIGVE